MDDGRGGRRPRRRPTCASLRAPALGRAACGRGAVARAAGAPARRTPLLATLLCARLGAVAAVDLVGQPAAAAAPRRALSRDDRALLHDVARDTWRLFERCVGAEDNHLPPDNLQIAPQRHGRAPHLADQHRPVPAGAPLCARDFGWIGTGELIERLEATLAHAWSGCRATAATS